MGKLGLGLGIALCSGLGLGGCIELGNIERIVIGIIYGTEDGEDKEPGLGENIGILL